MTPTRLGPPPEDSEPKDPGYSEALEKLRAYLYPEPEPNDTITFDYNTGSNVLKKVWVAQAEWTETDLLKIRELWEALDRLLALAVQEEKIPIERRKTFRKLMQVIERQEPTG